MTIHLSYFGFSKIKLLSVSSQARRKQLQIGGGGTHKFFYRLGVGGGGGAHIIFLKMTDLCNEQYSIFVQIIGGGGGGGGMG